MWYSFKKFKQESVTVCLQDSLLWFKNFFFSHPQATDKQKLLIDET